MKIASSILFFVCHYLVFAFVKIVSPFLAGRRPDNKRVLYLSPFFPHNAGYIYRSLKWAEILRSRGYEVDIEHLLNDSVFDARLGQYDMRFYLNALFKRTRQVLAARHYQIVIVRRELLLFNDYGRLFLEKLLRSINPNAILDFDDDISASKREPRQIQSLYGKLMLEDGAKFRNSLKLYNRFIVGSKYLQNLVLDINGDVHRSDICVIPTCVDYENGPTKNYGKSSDSDLIVFGWIGSNGNLPLLQEIIPQLNEVNETVPIKLIVISGKKISHDVDFEIENRQWSYESQIKDLLDTDIGLMPLNDNRRERGKCGFKLIQYMGLGIVAVASAVGTNNEIVDDRVDGFLVRNSEDWTSTLIEVIDSRNRFSEIGKLARKKIATKYSFSANTERYIEFLEKVKKAGKAVK